MTSAPIGKTYAFDGDFALTFESADSVSYRSLSALPTYSPHLCAKGHYTFDNGIVVVENPILDEWYWVEGQDTLPPCYLRLNGRFTALDVLEASFAFAMPGKIISGIGFLKIAKFSPFADNNYYIASFYTDKALDVNNDGKASTNLYEELTTGKQPCIILRLLRLIALRYLMETDTFKQVSVFLFSRGMLKLLWDLI